MYRDYYGIPEKPFSITPDPKYLYLGKTHKEAFAHLIYGIRERGGFIVITGEIGTGKTTLCRALLGHLDADTMVAFIFNPTLSAQELLKCINEDFGIRSQAGTQKELIDELNRFLLDKRQAGKNTVLIIDEAQNLQREVLESIRLLSNLETDTEKLLQIILIGQPEFRDLLEQPDLLQLNQRVTVRYHLRPLSPAETTAYVQHRLRVAGAEEKIRFTPGALRRISRCTKGVPRLINVLCDRALLAGYTLRTREIGGKIIGQAYREVSGTERLEKGRRLVRLLRRGLAPGLVLGLFFLVLVVGLNLWLTRGQITPWAKGSLPQATVKRQGQVASRPESPPSGGVTPAAGESAGAESGVPEGFPVSFQSPEALRADAEAAEAADGSWEEESTWVTGEADAFTQPDSGVSSGSRTMEGDEDISTKEPPAGIGEKDQDAQKSILVLSLAGQKTAETLNQAFGAVVRRWESRASQRATGSAAESVVSDIYRSAQKAGFQCFRFHGNFNRIRMLDVPAVLHLNLGEKFGKRYLALLALDGPVAEISPPLQDGSVRVASSLLEEFWFGTAYILWKDWAGGEVVLSPGMSGQGVRWAQSSLQKLGYLGTEPTGFFDSTTLAAVRRFQQDQNLEDDGILGPQTKISLFQAVGGYRMPSLASGQKR